MHGWCLALQLRVVNAFQSALEEMQERRSLQSVHSLYSLHSSKSHQRALAADAEPPLNGVEGKRRAHKATAVANHNDRAAAARDKVH